MLEIHPGSAHGGVVAAPSKSATHRAILVAALAEGRSILERPLLSADTLASLAAIEALGARVERAPTCLTIHPGLDPDRAATIDCANSGTTLRLMTGIAGTRRGSTDLDGDSSLRTRPMAPLLIALRAAGVTVETTNDRAPLRVHGPLQTRGLRVDGSQSSQFVSSLVLALTADAGGGTLDVDGQPVSAPYVEMTLAALARAGVEVERGRSPTGRQRLIVPAGIRPRGGHEVIPGDWSSAAFMLCAGALGGEVRVTGLPPVEGQADGAIVQLLRRAGAAFDGPLAEPGGTQSTSTEAARDWVAATARPLRGIEADLGACPDLFPVLAVTLAHAHGPSRLFGAPHLRGKETDRIALVADNLRRQGIAVEELADGIRLDGDARLAGGPIETRGDHRILMAFAVGALRARAPVTFADRDPDAVVGVSYPHFLDDLGALGVGLARRSVRF